MTRINMTAVLNHAHIGRAGDLHHSVGTIGLPVEQVLWEAVIISGSGDKNLLEPIRALGGVEEARPEHRFRLPPFFERIPQ